MFGINFNKINNEQADVYKSDNKGIAEIFDDYMGERVNAKLEECLEFPEVIEALSILDGLVEKYGKELEFHRKEHTLDVMHEVILFVMSDEKLNQEAKERVIKQQVIAAAWHDVGFIVEKGANEHIAVDLFKKSETYKKIMKGESGNLNEEGVEETIRNILDTKINFDAGYPQQKLENRSELKYLLDADLSNFGRPDFLEMNERVALELGIAPDDIEGRLKFYKNTIAFMENHEYQTESARILRNTRKAENLEKLKDIYHDLLAKK